MNETDVFLEHYGIKGMHWGVRNNSGTATSTKTDNTQRTQYKTPPAKLSSEELKRRIGRLEQEKRYNELNAATVSKGKKIAEEIFTDSGKKVAKTVLAGALLYGIKVAVTKKVDMQDAAGFITPKPKK